VVTNNLVGKLYFDFTCNISILSSLLVHAVDPRVLYSEPAKFVAKLRDMKTDDNILLFKCELGAGLFSKSGR
jgi:protease II